MVRRIIRGSGCLIFYFWGFFSWNLLLADALRPAPPKPLPLVMETSDGGFRKTTLWKGGKQRLGNRDILGPKTVYRKKLWWFNGIAYDIPVIKHALVDRALRKLIVNKRSQSITGIKRSGRYIPMIRRMLKEEGLPLDLVYMVAQESNFNEMARSRMNAVGLWQFIATSGRRFGLSINRWIDERRDPMLSTQAAIRYLKHLYGIFENWPLAMAAYNCGERRVQEAMNTAREKGLRPHFWNLKLPKETEHYVPSIMAQAILYNQRERFRFSHLKTAKPMDETRVQLPVAFSIEEVARRAKTSFQGLLKLNSALYRGFPPMNEEHYTLYLPKTSHAVLLGSLERNPQPERTWDRNYTQLVKDSPHMTRVLEHYGAPVYFRVKRGDNLWDLAKKHRTSVARLKRWNKLKSNPVLRVNQRLKLYVPTWQVFREIAKLPAIKKTSKLIAKRVRVNRGATLSLLAERHKTSVSKLLRWNKLRSAKSLRAGQKLIVGYRRVPADATIQRSYKWIKVSRHATLSHLAMRHRTSVHQLMRWNGLRSAKSLKAGQNLIVGYSNKVFRPISSVRSIFVKKNTTLSHLSIRYKSSVSQLMRWNGLKKATDLRAGMKLIVSKPSNFKDSTHHVIRVRSGDTLSKIAHRYRTSVQTLVALNDLKSKNLLRLNQRLLVPASSTNET